METIALFLILALAVLFWHDSLKNREFVIKQCRDICKSADLQLLDQTVSLNSIKLSRNDSGRITLLRLYEFAVSQHGTERVKGYLLLQQGIIESVWLVGKEGNIILGDASKTYLH